MISLKVLLVARKRHGHREAPITSKMIAGDHYIESPPLVQHRSSR